MKIANIRLMINLILLIMFSLYVTVENKYTFNKFNTNNREKATTEMLIRNYAMNLADTKLLKITNTLTLEMQSKKKKQLFDKIFGKNKNVNKLDVYEGSVLINGKGELTHSKEFIDENDTHILKGRKLIARARYTKSLGEIGWSRLYVETFDNTSAEIQSWAAGFLEGKLCAREILDFYRNLVGIHSKETKYLNDVFNYYKTVEESIRLKTSKPVLARIDEPKDLEYWISVAMVQAQTDGLSAGYNSVMKDQPLSFAQIYFLNADGEVPELLTVFKYRKENRSYEHYSFKERNIRGRLNSEPQKFSKQYLQYYFDSTDPEFIWNKLMSKSHCSALIKILKNEDNTVKDVLVGHTTWDSFSEMHRIFKVYKFSYTLYGNVKRNSHISFSSYPGTLTSTDDFYVLNNQVVVLETTLEMLDRSLYQSKIPDAEQHVPNYIRISVANRLTNSGKEWTQIFKQNNGGTYNSQWMILDFAKLASSNMQISESLFSNFRMNSKTKEEVNTNPKNDNLFQLYGFNFNFKQKLELQSNDFGFFYLMEQIPGYIEVKDMTNYLFERGFWASYNRPYFEKIYKDAGYHDMMNRYGKIYSYEDNPRAELFLSKVNSINDIESFKRILQTNTNIHNNDYINTISPRYDLAAKVEFRRPAGGIDSKVVSSELVKLGVVYAKSGPSTQGNAKPFKWTEWQDEPHYGLPEVWNFDWVEFNDNFVKNS